MREAAAYLNFFRGFEYDPTVECDAILGVRGGWEKNVQRRVESESMDGFFIYWRQAGAGNTCLLLVQEENPGIILLPLRLRRTGHLLDIHRAGTVP